jgi:uncharacterized protein YeeX (DUF496 family)
MRHLKCGVWSSFWLVQTGHVTRRRLQVAVYVSVRYLNSYITIHRDLGIETVTDIIAKFAKSHEKRLQDHINIEESRLLNVNNITRRLKRKKPFELVIR